MIVLEASSSAKICAKPDALLFTLDFESFTIFACPLWASKQVRVLFKQKLSYAPRFGISIAKLVVIDLLILTDCEPLDK